MVFDQEVVSQFFDSLFATHYREKLQFSAFDIWSATYTKLNHNELCSSPK